MERKNIADFPRSQVKGRPLFAINVVGELTAKILSHVSRFSYIFINVIGECYNNIVHKTMYESGIYF